MYLTKSEPSMKSFTIHDIKLLNFKNGRYSPKVEEENFEFRYEGIIKLSNLSKMHIKESLK